MPLFRKINSASLSDDAYFYLTRILHLALDLLSDLFCHKHRLIVIYELSVCDDTDLTASVDRISLLDALFAFCDVFDLFDTF